MKTGGIMESDKLRAKRELALEKYLKHEVSLVRAAELAKVPVAEFMNLAAERKIPVNYSVEDLKRDFEAALKAK
jgi:predicted HTH domain antitoxin